MKHLDEILQAYAAENEAAELVDEDGVLYLNIYAGEMGNTP